jgi:hypothetical protein
LLVVGVLFCGAQISCNSRVVHKFCAACQCTTCTSLRGAQILCTACTSLGRKIEKVKKSKNQKKKNFVFGSMMSVVVGMGFFLLHHNFCCSVSPHRLYFVGPKDRKGQKN